MRFHTIRRPLRRALPLLVLAAACESDITVSDVAVSLTIAPAADTIPLGTTVSPFTTVATNLAGDTIDATVRWSITSPAVATIDSTSGAVTAVSPGEASVIAHTGSLADTARLHVLGAFTLSLHLDTVLLAPGDTFAVPVTALGANGQPVTPAFSGADGSVATVSGTGLIQAVAPGRTSYTITLDSLTRTGTIDVFAVGDTTDGVAVLRISGALSHQVRLPSRWFQYASPGGSLLNIAARNAADDERVLGVLINGLSSPGSRDVGPFPEGVSATTAVCDPPNGWVVYQDRRSASIDALSTSGRIDIQRADPIPGGLSVSATIDVVLHAPSLGPIRIHGRFVGPLLSLASCPG